MTGHCRDCGEALDRFGICPFADAELVRIATAPVNCGNTPEQNAAKMRALLADAKPQEPGHKLPNFTGIGGNQR